MLHWCAYFAVASLSVDVGVLAGYRIGNRLFQTPDSLPFSGGANMAIASDLIDAPVDLYGMIVGIKKLDGNLASRPAAAFERERNVMRAQTIAHAKDLLERPDLESDVMQLHVL
jgi:hypothetical protein